MYKNVSYQDNNIHCTLTSKENFNITIHNFMNKLSNQYLQSILSWHRFIKLEMDDTSN